MVISSAAGRREFALAGALGFATRRHHPPRHGIRRACRPPDALPRISLNWQLSGGRFLPPLVSGAATALWNRFRRLDIGDAASLTPARLQPHNRAMAGTTT